MTKNAIGRRGLLRRLGLGSLALPFLPNLGGSARADGSAPRRLLIFVTGNGSVMPNWRPTGSGRNFELSRILRPLEDFKDRLVVCGGITQKTFDLGDQRPHAKAAAQLLTARELTTDANGSYDVNGPSIDQVIANQVGMETSYRSLEFGVWRPATYSFRGVGQGLRGAADPTAQYDRLFGDFTPPDAAPDPAIERRRNGRLAMLDLVGRQLGGARSRLGRTDGRRVEAHLENLSQIRGQLSNVNTMLSNGCSLPDAGLDRITGDLGSSEMYPIVSDVQCRIATAALACDMTRVATIVHGTSGNVGLSPNWVDYEDRPITDDHHDLGHQVERNDVMTEKVTLLEEWHAGQFARLLQMMDSVDEGDGTLLDNSIVAWLNPMSDGRHRMNEMPFVLAGGGCGALDTGRYLNFGGASHNDFLLSLAHLMGVTDERFGQEEFSTGPLGELV